MTSARARRRRALLCTGGSAVGVGGVRLRVPRGRVGRTHARAGERRHRGRERLRATAARDLSKKELDEAAIRGMLGALGDRYATYYDSTDYAQFQQLLDGRYSGVGLWLGRCRPARSR